MLPDLSTTANSPLDLLTPPSPKQSEALRWKYRARFRKAGDLRFVSHHDLMHVIERMFRRADLHVCVTQGFNPHPKLTFALSLALGVAGLNEVLEFELAASASNEAPVPLADLETRLQQQCPPGLEIVSVRAIDFRASAQVRRAIYRINLSKGPGVRALDLASRCTALLAQPAAWVERKRPHPRRINVRPFVHELHIDGDCLTMALWITPNGAARPEEVIAALGLAQLLDAGAVIERTDLEIYDELPPDAARAPAIQSAFEEITTNDKTPPSDRPTAIFDSAMSFET